MILPWKLKENKKGSTSPKTKHRDKCKEDVFFHA